MWNSVQPKGLWRSVQGMLKAKVRERKGPEDQTREREQRLGLSEIRGMYLMCSTMYRV